VNERVILTGLVVASVALAPELPNSGSGAARKETTMIARGAFDVTATPQRQDDTAGGPFGRLFLDKQFRGDLQGSSKGQMLAARTPVEESGAYVAFELVTGALNGKPGSFILQHRGTMRKGVYSMDVTVVPDSGSGELSGIRGAMKIIIEGRRHSYELEYAFEKE